MELMVPADIACPYCGEIFPVAVDTSQPKQTLIEDCSVCCRPITLRIRCLPGEVLEISSAN